MFETILKNRALYDQRLMRANVELETQKLNNKKIDQYKEELSNCQTIYSKVYEYINALKLVESASIKEAKEYQTRKIESLNSTITEAISKIFPNRRVTAKLQCDFSRTDKVSLVLYDENNDTFAPGISEGKLMQYLISVSAVEAITKSLNGSNIFIDEAFGVARVDHLEDLGDLLQGFINDGMQTVVIAQNSILYHNLPRHEIHLEEVHENDERYAIVAKIEDY